MGGKVSPCHPLLSKIRQIDMKAQTNYLFVLVLVFLVSVGCSTGGLKERAELRTLISSANWDQAIDYVAKSDFYKTENVALLQAMELGLLYNSKGAYFQSTKMLNKAKEIHQKLFTVSISSAAKVCCRENYDVYSGASYERSLIHFIWHSITISCFSRESMRDIRFPKKML